ncbi:response regulator [Singulisphaera rosea]
MASQNRVITILMADDDPDDCEFTSEALKQSRLINDLRIVRDGEQLLDYLLLRGDYENDPNATRPDLILLDLNMPRMDGRDALRAIKLHPDLKRIPVVILTTSKAEEDIFRSYDLGANSFITKPVSFSGLVQVMKDLGRYWFEIVDLPNDPERA